MPESNFQLRVHKRFWGYSLPSAESNFRLRSHEGFLDQMRKSLQLLYSHFTTPSAENKIHEFVRRGPSHDAERNFQLRVTRSDPNLYIMQRSAQQTVIEKIRQTLMEKIRESQMEKIRNCTQSEKIRDSLMDYVLRVRRSSELTQKCKESKIKLQN